MNKSSFLDYYKTILEKVSFDKRLLNKEYKKAKTMLGAAEARELDSWLNYKGLSHHLDVGSEKKSSAWHISRTPRVDNL